MLQNLTAKSSSTNLNPLLLLAQLFYYAPGFSADQKIDPGKVEKSSDEQFNFIHASGIINSINNSIQHRLSFKIDRRDGSIRFF